MVVLPLLVLLQPEVRRMRRKPVSVERLPNGPAKLVTFLPAFWLLVPGATGLIGVTQIVGTGPAVAARGLSDTPVTIASISLGVLIGAAAYRTADAGSAVSGRHSRWLGLPVGVLGMLITGVLGFAAAKGELVSFARRLAVSPGAGVKR